MEGCGRELSKYISEQYDQQSWHIHVVARKCSLHEQYDMAQIADRSLRVTWNSSLEWELSWRHQAKIPTYCLTVIVFYDTQCARNEICELRMQCDNVKGILCGVQDLA